MTSSNPKIGPAVPDGGDEPVCPTPVDPAPDGAAVPIPPCKLPERVRSDASGALDDVLVSELIVALKESGITPSGSTGRGWSDFDVARALRSLEPRSYAAAEAEIAAARRRGAIPNRPIEPPTALALDLEWYSLALTGLSHYRRDIPCQDACVVEIDPVSGSLCGVVADGVSQAPLSHHASKILGGAVARIARDLIIDTSGRFRAAGSIMNPAFLGELHHRTTKAYLDLCEQTGFHPEEAQDHFLATTLQLLIVTPTESAVFALSDGVYGWVDRYENVSTKTERRDPGYNTPPLFERTLIEEGKRQQYGMVRSIIRPTAAELALIAEAEAFKVVAYGPSSEVVKDVIEMASDGAGYTDMKPFNTNPYFPPRRTGGQGWALDGGRRDGAQTVSYRPCRGDGGEHRDCAAFMAQSERGVRR